MSPAAILAVLLSLPAWHLDRDPPEARSAMLRPVADVIAEVSADATDAAALIALGWHETKYARLVLEGRCSEMPEGNRCDDGRARGAWQLWHVACPSAYAFPAGSPESLRAEATCARRLLRGQLGRCRARHPAGDWAGAFAGYRGASCVWPAAARRARTMLDLLARLRRAEP